MTRAVEVLVTDSNGNGRSGQTVKEYGQSAQYTDGNGYATLAIDGSNTTIYVNGHQAYDGPVSRMGDRMIFDTCGRRRNWTNLLPCAFPFPGIAHRKTQKIPLFEGDFFNSIVSDGPRTVC